MSLEPFTTLLAARHRFVLGAPEPAQRALLRKVLAHVRGTSLAGILGITGNESFEEFLGVPPQDYSCYAPLVERTFNGERDIFSRDPIVAFGETSGSRGQPKMIPHTTVSLNAIRRFAERVLLFQLLEGVHYVPHFTKWLSVTASVAVRVERGIPVGFISGLMYQIAQKKRRGMLLPTPRVAAIADWDERIRQSVREAWTKPVGTMLGVPAYLVRFLEEASRQASGRPLGDIWPMLGRVYYSGTSIDAHRTLMERTIGRSLVIRGLYTATEGSFGAELEPRFPGELSLMVDLVVFAFRDLEDAGSRLRSAWEVSVGRHYEVFVTTLSGLVQYAIGDVLEVTSTRPLRVRVTGRAQDDINLATEKLSITQVATVIGQVSDHASIHPDHFMVLPDPIHPRRHLWIVEALSPLDEAAIGALIDSAVARINPSYAALRQGGAILAAPRVLILPQGCFEEYIATGFSTRGQFKFRQLFPDAPTLLRTPGLSALRCRIGT